MKKQPKKRPRKPKQRVLIDRNSACDANDSDELEWLEQDWDDEIIFCADCGREYKIQGGRARLISK